MYRRGSTGADPELSFRLEPVWRAARGEGLPLGEVERFRRFATQFSHQALDTNQRIVRIRQATSWRQLEATGETAVIDVEYLVDRLRDLSATLAEDAAAQQELLDRSARFNPGLVSAIVAELGTLANEIEPGDEPEDPASRSCRLPRRRRPWPAASGSSTSCASRSSRSRASCSTAPGRTRGSSTRSSTTAASASSTSALAESSPRCWPRRSTPGAAATRGSTARLRPTTGTDLVMRRSSTSSTPCCRCRSASSMPMSWAASTNPTLTRSTATASASSTPPGASYGSCLTEPAPPAPRDCFISKGTRGGPSGCWTSPPDRAASSWRSPAASWTSLATVVHATSTTAWTPSSPDSTAARSARSRTT